jgi:hypothetical protein
MSTYDVGGGTVTLHTSATYDELMEVVRSFESDLTAAAGMGDPDISMGEPYTCTAAGGERDCFYGWWEPQNSGQCLPHTIIDPFNNRDYAPDEVARELIAKGFQVVWTDTLDYSKVVSNAFLPTLYLAEHTH